MKTKLAMALLALGLSGCANLEHDPNPISTFFHGPSTASTSDVQKMAEFAWPKFQEGKPLDDACKEARSQLKIKSRSEFLDASACRRILEPKAREQSLEKERQRHLANAQRRAEQFDQRIAGIRSGLAEIQTAKEAEVIYNAPSGQQLSLRPLVQPDGKKYTISGLIDASGGLQQDRFMLRITEFGEPRYAYVYLQPKSNRLPSSAHVDSHVIVVGSYVENMPYTTIIGEQRAMPVFNAMFVKVLR